MADLSRDSGGAGAAFVADLCASLPPEARRAVERVVQRWAGSTLYLPSRKTEERCRVAAMLLASGLDGADIAQALMQRFGVCRSTAWADVKKIASVQDCQELSD